MATTANTFDLDEFLKDSTGLTANSTYSTTNTGGTGNYFYNGPSGGNWNTSPYIVTTTSGSTNLSVSGDATFEGDITWKGRSLGKLLEKIEDRLAILADPDPKKLEKFAALKKAYDNYKLLEKLIGDDQ